MKNTNTAVAPVTPKFIRIFDSAGDVDAVVRTVSQELKDRKIVSAAIDHNLSGISQNPADDAHYPLRLMAEDGTVIMVSEVRCGYRGHSTKAMLEVLKIAGFELKRHLVDTIFNEKNLELTLYK